MSSSGLSSISASSCDDKVHDLVSCRFHTIVLLLVINLAFLLPYIVQMMEIHYCGVLLSYMWYTKRLLLFPCSYYGSAEMLSSLNPPSSLR
jgi:hypothetical protein